MENLYTITAQSANTPNYHAAPECALALGLQGTLVVGSSTPCPSAFRAQPFVPHGGTTPAKSEGQGVRPLQPRESSTLRLRRFARRSAPAPRRQVAPSLLVFLWVVSVHDLFSDLPRRNQILPSFRLCFR